MSALYFTLGPAAPLSQSDRAWLSQRISEYNAHALAELSEEGGGERFSVYSVGDGLELNASVGLPMEYYPDEIDDFMAVVEHWLDLLAEIRLRFPEGRHEVHIEGDAVKWNPARRQYLVGQ